MKVAHAETHVLGSHGLSETKAFQIRTNAHAFKLLSSGLYSDKIAAVLREIGCNAMDAHIAQGTPNRPIEVKLPNRIDNQFYIRDYGPGLSHDEVMNLYTTYFASTKQNSNDFTGAFGLGSKSPFSYTDQFTVISVHGGVQRTYSAYLDNTGSPTISLLSDIPADPNWEHGVQIGFPVKQEDFNNFQMRAQSIYAWFKVLPHISGASQVRLQQPTFHERNNLFMYFNPSVTNSKWGVVMGNVFYPVDLAKLNIPGLYYNRNADVLTFAHAFQGIVMPLNIGDVQVAASREELQYDPQSITFLKERITRVLEFIGNNVATQLRNAKTWQEKCEIHQHITDWRLNSYDATWAGFFQALKFHDAQHLGGLTNTRTFPVPKVMGNKSNAKIVVSSNRKTGYDFSIVTDGEVPYYGNTKQAGTVKLYRDTLVLYGPKTNALVKAKTLLHKSDNQILLFTPNEALNLGVKEAEAEARQVAAELGITNIENLDNVAVPSNHVSAKPRKKKGAHLQPLPSVTLKTVRMGAKQTLVEDISKLKADSQFFMVRSPKSGWGGQDRMRVYEKTADADICFDLDAWDRIWNSSTYIASKVGSPIAAYVELGALEVKRLDLVKRGWKTAYDRMKEWLTDPATKAKIQDEVNNWRPSINIERHHSHGWVGAFLYLRNFYPKVYDQVRPILDYHGLNKEIESLYMHSKKTNSISEDAPTILHHYEKLRGTFNLDPIERKNGGYITVADFNRSLVDKFKLMEVFNHAQFTNLIEHSAVSVKPFVELLFK